MGTTMKSKRTSRRPAWRAGIRPAGRAGEGFAWLILDAGDDLFRYQCDDHMIERARMATDAEAVDWAPARIPRARIRMPDHRAYSASSAPCPNGFARTGRGSIGTSNATPVSVLV